MCERYFTGANERDDTSVEVFPTRPVTDIIFESHLIRTIWDRHHSTCYVDAAAVRRERLTCREVIVVLHFDSLLKPRERRLLFVVAPWVDLVLFLKEAAGALEPQAVPRVAEVVNENGCILDSELVIRDDLHLACVGADKRTSKRSRLRPWNCSLTVRFSHSIHVCGELVWWDKLIISIR